MRAARRVLLALLPLALPAAGCFGRRADYMPLAVGNRWDYRIATSDGRRARRRLVVTGKVSALTYRATDGDEASLWSKEDGWVSRQQNGELIYLLYLPPVTGAKWQNVMGAKRIRAWCRIDGRETVSVPAGVFKDCVVVVMEAAGSRTELRYWFAPDVGWVKFSYGPRGGRPRLVRDLVDYDLRPPERGK